MKTNEIKLLTELNLQFFGDPAIKSPLVVGKVEDVSSEYLLLSPQKTPMLDLVGFGKETQSSEIAWFEDETYATKTTASAIATDAATTLKVADGSIFEKDTVIKVGEELLLVTAVAGNDLTVTRGYAGTTAAAVAVGDKVEFQFVEGVEGADARKARFKARVRKSNITQIFDGTISISGTAAAESQIGIANLYEEQRLRKQEELFLQLEKAEIGRAHV